MTQYNETVPTKTQKTPALADLSEPAQTDDIFKEILLFKEELAGQMTSSIEETEL
jgi:hypothetical protein